MNHDCELVQAAHLIDRALREWAIERARTRTDELGNPRHKIARARLRGWRYIRYGCIDRPFNPHR